MIIFCCRLLLDRFIINVIHDNLCFLIIFQSSSFCLILQSINENCFFLFIGLMLLLLFFCLFMLFMDICSRFKSCHENDFTSISLPMWTKYAIFIGRQLLSFSYRSIY